MASEKQSPKKQTGGKKRKTMDQLRREHPFETDSQIQNRYGDGRRKGGSESTPSQDEGRGSNH